MKKGLLPIISILVISFASAQSFSDMLNQIDSSLILLSAIFAVSFLLINLSLSKVFKEQKNIGTIISLILSFLIVFGISRLDVDLPSFFFDLGISEDVLLTIAPILVLAGLIFIVLKFARESLIIIGGFFILLSVFVEDKIVLIMVGVILVIIRFFIPKDKWKMKRKGYKNAGTGI